MSDFFLNVLLALSLLLTVFLVITAVSHIWVKVPFIPTPLSVIREVMSFADIQDGEHVYDLGAGDARMLIEAKKTYPSITAIGSEFIPTVWLLGKIRILFSGQKVTLLRCNALHQDVSQADCIFLYLIPSVMKKLEKKFDAELQPGTRVVSYAFSFPGKQPEKELVVPWITGERKLRLYRW